MKAPAHLAPSTRAWFASVVATYHLEPHHLRLLQLAAEAWDRCQQAREAIACDGLIMIATGRAHPAVAIERDSRLAFARLIRELDLDAEPPSAWSRPPALHSNRRNLRGGIGITLDDQAMPRKLRAPKQRYDAKAELEVWSMSFECGTDFFGETGFPLPHRVQPPEDQPAAERAFRVAAHAAWLRVGSLFLQKRDADKEHRAMPWALEQFGPPCR